MCVRRGLWRLRQMGEKIAGSLSDFFNDPENLRTLKTLTSLGFHITNPDFEYRKEREETA